MASRRMVPTKFFKDPDIMNLESKDSQLILIGLILAADDEGREVAHAQLLGRELDYPPETIERALQDLAANDLIILYQVGKHRYYYLTRWNKWQTINRSRMVPSRYPAPPLSEQEVQVSAENPHADSGEKPTPAGKMHADSGEKPAQFKLSESNRSKENGVEGQEQTPPSNIVIFPTTTRSSDNADGEKEKERFVQTMIQVASILKLPEGEALFRVVQDYHADPSLSLLGEADAAREWIDDPHRNKKHKRMSPAFFRHWLQRERESRARRVAEHAAAAQQMEGTGTTGKPGGVAPGRGGPAPTSPGAGLASRSLMGLEAQYRRAAKQGGSPS